MSDAAVALSFFAGFGVLAIVFFVWWIVGAVNEMQELFGRRDKQ